MRVRSLIALLTMALTLLALPAAALAQCPQTSVADIEDEVMCPVCGTPLALATETPQAQRERRFIFELVEQCQSKEEIKAALVAEFGESVLALPGNDGFDAAAYLVPALAGVAALGAIGFAVTRWRRGPRTPSQPSGGAASNEESARLDADLGRYDL